MLYSYAKECDHSKGTSSAMCVSWRPGSYITFEKETVVHHGELKTRIKNVGHEILCDDKEYIEDLVCDLIASYPVPSWDDETFKLVESIVWDMPAKSLACVFSDSSVLSGFMRERKLRCA